MLSGHAIDETLLWVIGPALLGVLLLATLGLCIWVGVLNRRLRQLAQQHKADQDALLVRLTTLTQQVEVLNKGSMGVGKRLMATEKRLNQTMERQEEIESKEWEQASFTQASRLIEKGVAIHEVVDKVGISRSEARLVDLVRRKTLQPQD